MRNRRVTRALAVSTICLLTIGVLAKNARAVRAYEGAGYAPYTVMMRRYLGA